MLSLREISDRLEIQDLLVRYAHAVDSRQWELLDEVFTDDAFIDYTAMGGPAGDLKSTKEFLATVMPNFPAFQHLVSNSAMTFDGDTATVRTMCYNPMLVNGDGGAHSLMMCGLWYLDTVVRVDGQWRIRSRVEEKSFMYLAPATGGS